VNGSSVVRRRGRRQCASNNRGKNRYNPLNRGSAIELRRTDR
jgi:hypothetical protein